MRYPPLAIDTMMPVLMPVCDTTNRKVQRTSEQHETRAKKQREVRLFQTQPKTKNIRADKMTCSRDRDAVCLPCFASRPTLHI